MPPLETNYPAHLETSPVRFRKILVAVDFSKQTHATVEAGIRLAVSQGAELILVNAATPALYGTGAEPIPIETFEVNLEVTQARMAELIHSLPELSYLRNREVVAYSNAVDLIQQVIKDESVDLVIAGSHGAKGVERLALGSTAECILRTVSCPVLIVGPHAEISEDIFHSLVLATKLEPRGLRSAQYAASLAEQHHAHLVLVHVVEPKHHEESCESEAGALEQLEALVPADIALHAVVTKRVELGKVGEVIPELAREVKATIVIVAGREDRPFADHAPWSSLAEIIREVPCPVLCVPGHLM